MSKIDGTDNFSEEEYFNFLLLRRMIKPYRWGFDTYEVIQRDTNPLPENLPPEQAQSDQDSAHEEEDGDQDTVSVKEIYKWFLGELDNKELREIRDSVNQKILQTLEAPTEEPDDSVFAAIYG